MTPATTTIPAYKTMTFPVAALQCETDTGIETVPLASDPKPMAPARPPSTTLAEPSMCPLSIHRHVTPGATSTAVRMGTARIMASACSASCSL